MPRKNPDLILLTNPHRAPRAWEKFHYADGRDAEWVQIPDVRGIPGRSVWALGFWTGLDMEDGTKARARWNQQDGPWLLSSSTDAGRLWIVARHAGQLAPLTRCDGGVVKAVLYLPSKTSGKYVPGSPYHHVFGDGGALPKSRWPEVYPTIRKIAPNAYVFVPPARHAFRVKPAGITG